jgi:hypothetical protein
MSKLSKGLTLVFFAFSLSTSVSFASDPTVKWQTIETPHFSVIFDSRQQRLAQIYAVKAEQAFSIISPTFGYWPEKTVIYLDDSTDLSNGSATPLPYPTIMAYPVLPLSNDVVGAYGDWGLELLTHEYTHILNFAPANGVMKPLRWVFGSIVAPNVLLPRWYSEGLAVEMETRYSKFGRLRSETFLSIARAMAEEGKLRNEDIGRINESIPDFPGGNRAYLMGSLVWDELTRQAGDKIIGELNTAYSRRVPFFINGPLHDRLNLKWQDLLNDVYDRVEKRTLQQIAIINAAGRMQEKLIARDGYYTRSPMISPDGQKLIYISQTVNTDNLIMLMNRSGDQSFSIAKSSAPSSDTKDKRLVEAPDVNRLSWLPDSASFIYDSVDTVNRYYDYSDLYRCQIIDGKKCKVDKLTKGLRAREPAVSLDGRFIVFVQNTAGSTRLVATKIDGTSPHILFEPAIQTRVSNPTFVSANEIVFSERQADGTEALRYARLKETTAGDLTLKTIPTERLKEFSPARLPQMTSKGLVFLSDRSGLTNLYLADANLKTARALTNTTTRVLDGIVDPQNGDILYSRLEASGSALFALDAKDSAALPSTPPTVEPLIDTSYPTYEIPKVNTTSEITDYHPGSYLWPRYWFPYAYALPGGFYAQASTSGGDPVGHHAYSVTGAYDSFSHKPSVFGAYINSTTRVPITLIGEDITEYLASTGIERQTTAGSILASFFLPGLNNHWHGGIGWEYLQTDAQNYLTDRNGADISLSFKNFEQRGYQISPEKGGSASVTHRHFFEKLGNIGYDETDVSLSKYFSGFVLPDHHVLAFFANAAWAPALNRTILGRSTVGGNYQNGLIQDAFVMRGYQSGVFLGKDMVTGTAEYRFPLLYSYHGLGTAPLFFRRLHAAIFADAITLDGLAYRKDIDGYQRESFGTFHLGTGVELKIDTTLFYFLPAQLIVGGYYGIDRTLNPDNVFPFIGLGI